MKEIIQKEVMTCEGNIINIDGFDYGLKVVIPLKEVKYMEYSEIFERYIPIHFRETFTKDISYYQEDEDSEKVVFISWRSTGIE